MTTETRRLAYCSVCHGVLPFGEVRYWRGVLPSTRFECQRCGTIHRRANPGAPQRRGSRRFLLYSIAAGAAPASLIVGLILLDADYPPLAWGEAIAFLAMGALSLACLARSIVLAGEAARFERLTSWEIHDLGRSLCPGMIRSDVVDELARRGWRIGKIRTALAALEPAG